MKTILSRNKVSILRNTLFVLALVALPSAASQGAGQGSLAISGPLTLSVTSHRPMADMLDKIQELFRSPIDFEEAAYVYEGDLEKRNVVLSSGPSKYPIPAEGQFSVTLQPGDSSVYLAAQAAVAAYSAAALPGSYKVTQSNGRVAVVPVQVREVNGLPTDVIPVTSRLLNFPIANRSALDTLEMALKAAAAAAGVNIVLLEVHVPYSATIQIGASGESLGDFIADFRQKAAGGDCFRLLYEPGDKTYYLNLMSVGTVPVVGYSASSPQKLQAPAPHSGPANSRYFTKTPQP